LSLFDELKRRNVIRVSMAYLAGAWLIVQVLDTIIPWMGLSEAVGRVTLIVLMLGFLPTAVAAWVFEWTPDGIRFDDEVEVDSAGKVVARRRLDRIIIGVLALAVVYFAVDKFLLDARDFTSYDGTRSIAVLPFEDISPNGDQRHFADGIPIELRLALQHLEGLRVAGQTFSTRYAGEDTKTIGEILDVEAVLEGNVRTDGNRIRITVQLTRASDGFILWMEKYDSNLEKIFELQEDIAKQVAGRLGVTLGVGTVNAFRGAGTQNLEAYEAYLQARSLDLLPENNERAIELLKRATKLDPQYGVAWSALGGRVLSTIWDVDLDEVPAVLDRAHELVRRGLELDPESAWSQSIMAVILRTQRDWIGAEQSHVRAIELLADRRLTELYGFMLIRSGRMAAAQEQFDRAMALEPVDGRPPTLMWHVLLAQGRIAETRDIIARWNDPLNAAENRLDVAFNDDDPEALKAAIREWSTVKDDYLSVPYTHLYSTVLEEFESPESVLSFLHDVYLDKTLQWPRKLHDISMLAVYFGDPEFALKVKGEELRVSTSRMTALWYPVWSEIRQSQGFKDLVRDLNLVDYWRAYGWADACRRLGEEDFECS